MPDLTPEQNAFLQMEQFIQAALKAREPEPAAKEGAPSSAWLTFLQSASGTALITVLLGTIGGGIITQIVQSHIKDRETHALALADYLKNEEKIANEVFVMIGKATAAAEDMAIITEQQFYTGVGDNLTSPDRAALEHQKDAIIANFNTVDSDWRRNRDSLGLFMRLYHRNDAAVVNAWENTAATLTDFMDCERSFNLDHSRTERSAAQAACSDMRGKLHDAENSLTKSLSDAQVYTW